jgi:Zn-dependent protease with chaperone function/tellurite resistance protein
MAGDDAASKLRCQGDRLLSEKLLADPTVRRVIARIERREEESPLGVRRRLLSSALRLTPAMSPEVHAMVDRCRDRLGVEIPLEIYVYPSAAFNAACVKPERGRLFILLSSSLLEAFVGAELSFVIGHELGHHVFDHHDIPVGVILQGKHHPGPELVLELFSWSRYAEISADRAGAVCAGDPDASANALFRLASGLKTDVVKVSIDDFAAQVDDMQLEAGDPALRAPEADWFTTHPFSPLRVKALKHFAESEIMAPEGDDRELLEAKVETLMALMEPSYLDARTELAERMRRLLFAGAIAVAAADHTITDREIAVFEKFFGERSFSSRLDVDALARELPARIADVRDHVPPARRVQVLRDLCLVARADGPVDPRAIEVLRGIARDLELTEAVVDRALQLPIEPH